MQNLRKLEHGKFAVSQMQRRRGRGVPTSVKMKNRTTHELPTGTAKRFVEFTAAAAQNGVPLNTLLTLRWHALWAEGASYPYLSLPVRERVSKSVELLRKFTTNRGSKFPWIWVQENPTNQHGGLHWHIAFHSKPQWRGELTDYVENHFGISRLPKFLVRDATQGELARSEAQAWHLAVDTHPEREGRNLALYVGKGDPTSEEFVDTSIRRRGYRRQGCIEGTSKDRFALSRIGFE